MNTIFTKCITYFSSSLWQNNRAEPTGGKNDLFLLMFQEHNASCPGRYAGRLCGSGSLRMFVPIFMGHKNIELGIKQGLDYNP